VGDNDNVLSEIDEVMSIYKGPKAKNRDVIRRLLRDLDGWAKDRGYDLQEEMAAILETSE
jgi:hypothetical protein